MAASKYIVRFSIPLFKPRNESSLDELTGNVALLQSVLFEQGSIIELLPVTYAKVSTELSFIFTIAKLYA